MNRSAITISALLAASALSAIASADNLQYIGLDYTGTITGDVTFKDNGKSVTEDAYIGKLLFKDGSTDVSTVCADITSELNGSVHTYSVSSTNPANKNGLSYAGDIVAADFSKATNASEGAALQLAVWSAEYNGGSTFNANGSGFKVTGVSQAILAQAATYYQDYDKAGSAKYFEIAANCGGQSQLTANPAPEPASMAALVLGAGGLIARRRKARA